jgi:hypothetical protein
MQILESMKLARQDLDCIDVLLIDLQLFHDLVARPGMAILQQFYQLCGKGTLARMGRVSITVFALLRCILSRWLALQFSPMIQQLSRISQLWQPAFEPPWSMHIPDIYGSLIVSANLFAIFRRAMVSLVFSMSAL